MMSKHLAAERISRFSRCLSLWSCCLLALALGAWAQNSYTGAVSGRVTDPSGAVIVGASVHLDQKATNAHLRAMTGSSGTFSFPGLTPGNYVLTVTAKGFTTLSQPVVVRVGQVTNAPAAMRLGSSTTTVKVTTSAATVQVNTQTATVGGVITAQQIKDLPQIGRNFLDLAQLQPGAQIIDGGNFDPTKNGFAGLSIDAAEGRTTDINVDGADITDQTVGTTTMNLNDNSIREFQVSTSSLDTSSDIGNTGEVFITSKSGTNTIHGEGFANYRSDTFAANPTTIANQKPPFKQNQDGLDFGGPFLHNRLFWFVSGERTYRDQSSAVEMPDFPNYSGFFPSPGEEKLGQARLDWQALSNLKIFYEIRNDSLSLVPPSTVGGTTMQPFTNENITNLNVVGATLQTGNFTHQFHYDHLGFFNHIFTNPVAGLPTFPFAYDFGDTGENFGPNLLSPQHTFQINDEFRYDGSWFWGNHTLRYGFEYNHIANVVFASFFSSAPTAFTSYSDCRAFLGGAAPTNPMQCPPEVVVFGNGLGYFSNLAVHGNPFGGVYNPRKSFYLTDNWRVTPTLALNIGVHFERDPGEVNSDLTKPGALIAFSPKYATFASIPNNWSPTIGLAWDPTGHGTTSIRAGYGIYYQNNIWNNVMFERSDYISTTIAPGFPAGLPNSPVYSASGACLFECPGGGQNTFTQSGNQLSSAIVAAQAALQASYAALKPDAFAKPLDFESPAPGVLTPGTAWGNPLFDNTYQTPYSEQFNLGIQHQFAPGVVLSANFVRNRSFHLLMIQNANFVGAARYLNKAVAIQAINDAAAGLGVTQGATPADTMHNFAVAIQNGQINPNTGNPMTQNDVVQELASTPSGYSLGSSAEFVVGSPSAAFDGLNPNYNNMSTYRNLGSADYKALQIRLTIQKGKLLRLLHSSNLMVSYSLSRNNSTQFDQAFGPGATDNDNPGRFFGPNGYDRTNQLSFGSIFYIPGGIRISSVGHFFSGFPVTPRLATLCGCNAEIFQTDWTGDGTTGDIVPGTNVGSFGRSIANPGELQALINNYNSNMAGSLTPAGQALVKAGLANAADLQAIGLAMPFINATVNPGQIMPSNFMDADMSFARPIHIGERFRITPRIDVFNIFNFANYDPPGNTMIGTLTTDYVPGAFSNNGIPGSITDTTMFNRNRKYGLNTGPFAAGIPRAFQFDLEFSF